jgi:hypothetical protein
LLHALPKAMGLADQLDDVGMMSQTIQQCCRQAIIAKYLHPVGEL